MNVAPEDVLFYIADNDMRVSDVIWTLYENPSQKTIDHFLSVNSHLKNGYVLLGQMVIITPDDPVRCSIWEAELIQAARVVDEERKRLTAKERQALANHYALLNGVASYSSTFYGWTNTYFDQKKKHVERILNQLETLYRTTYDKTGSLKGNDFFAKRRSLLLGVDTTINGMMERQLFGRDVQANRIKSQLGLSSKSIVHQWRAQGGSGDIRGFESNYRQLTNTARHFSRLGHVSIVLDVGSSVASIAEACAVEPDGEFCRRTRYSETGRATGSILLGAGGGWAGAYGVCNLVFGVESLGTSLLWCTIVAGAVGGYTGGQLGSHFGSAGGATIHDTIYDKRHAVK